MGIESPTSKVEMWAIVEINSNYIEYSEGDHFAIVPGGVLVGDENEAGYILYDNLFERWEEPFRSEKITPNQKEEILARISVGLEKRGVICRRAE